MPELSLTWQEAGQTQTATFGDPSPYFPQEVKIGRDRAHCDLTLSHPTVSGLHVAIFFDPTQQQFKLRNLRETNPPLVDGKKVETEAIPLRTGSTVQLGQMTLQVRAISIPSPQSHIPQTILLPPKPASTPSTPAPQASYGLKCPNCSRVSPYERIDFGCQWCGTSLAAAVSVLIQP
jgi:predicted component of type VI protein secretion system